MNQEHRTEIVVGFFLIAAILILVLGILWGKGAALFSDHQSIMAEFSDVTGLEKGDPVVVRGISMGKVRDISLQPDGVLVTLSLSEKIVLNDDLSLRISGRDLMGGKQVVLDPGKSNVEFKNENIVKGSMSGDIMVLMGRAEKLISRVDSTVSQIGPILASGQIQKTMTGIETTLLETRSLIRTVKPKWVKTSDRIEMATRQLEGDSTLSRIKHLTVKMEHTLSGIDSLTHRIETQEGTLGKLVRDRGLYNELLKTTQEMDSLILDIKKNPKRYLHVSLF